ncbi:calcium-binding protein [Microvirga rosea]|uniref:calcium-binding protein n=1 Tax=Microvirga rosea TaxID=2715425 RepID=UPI0022231CCC|nr:calcium-binding protein [Microvirga rosea]
MSVRKSGTVGYGGHDLNSLTYEPARYVSNGASDRVIAGNGPNELYGNGGNDTLYGRGGDDLLVGGAGRDTLLGGKGADYFVFDRAPSATNVDRVLDFSRSQKDKVVLAYKYFQALDLSPAGIKMDMRLDLKVGHLTSAQLRLGETAQLETDRFIYNKTNGALSYDQDGTGVAEAVKVADFKPGTTLAASDFLFF